ncbi:hypothetical protein PsorP6_017082 [Peronosclerospora sorghi]|uniref:Uncharacterized protein n=1 Tax=Peronosclerospora sorghi TaxID=230839 RepID=A0ACC0WDN9_9STRA|nr:hypothetical protein PsorP6_017082 [Peronosclerospora sorghi]
MAPLSASVKEKKKRYKLVLRVHSAEELQHSSSQGAYCKLYVGSSAMTEGRHKSGNRKDGSDAGMMSREAPDERHWHLEVRRTRTQHQQPNVLAPPETIWDQVFEVPLHSNVDQILSIRVKSQHLFFCPVIGACAVSLANLCPGERLEQWFPLQRGKKAAGRIRIMMMLVPEDKIVRSRRKEPNQDVMVARAAHHEADEAIKRLVENQLRQEAERRQRRLRRTSSGPPMEVNRSASMEPDRCGMDTNVVRDTRHKNENYATWPPPFHGFVPHPAPTDPSLASKEDPRQEEDGPSPPPSAQGHVPVASMAEYEARIDRKLRQVRKETARLRQLKHELKQYIPDLQMDSDSEDSVEESEAESDTQLSGTSRSSTCSSSEKVYVKEMVGTRKDKVEDFLPRGHAAPFHGLRKPQDQVSEVPKDSAVAF